MFTKPVVLWVCQPMGCVLASGHPASPPIECTGIKRLQINDQIALWPSSCLRKALLILNEIAIHPTQPNRLTLC